jgi:hypothetical protein
VCSVQIKKGEADMFRVILLMGLVALTSACAQMPQQNLAPAQLAFMEAQNAEIVEVAARGCNQQGNVYPVGASAYDFAEHFAEEADEVTILIVGLCMQDNVAVAQAADDCNLSDDLILSEFGYYAYRPEFVSDQGDNAMIGHDRCVLEQIKRRNDALT